jgi:hypothetical protein
VLNRFSLFDLSAKAFRHIFELGYATKRLSVRRVFLYAEKVYFFGNYRQMGAFFSLESLHPRKWCATIKCHTEDNVKEKLETIGVILNESEY